MNYLKLLFFILIVSILSCNHVNNKSFSGFKKYAENKSSIIISCVKCGCVTDELNKISEQNPKLLKEYDIYIDSTCKANLDKNIKTQQISQKTIDSISTEFYNILILKKKDKDVEIQNLKSKDITKLENLMKE